MRTVITVIIAAILIFASSFVTGVVAPRKTAADREATIRPIPSYRVHFGGTSIGSYCPGEVNRALEPKLPVEAC